MLSSFYPIIFIVFGHYLKTMPIFQHAEICLKAHSPKKLKKAKEFQSAVNVDGKGIWQRRFWEHSIRNQLDYNRHVDYIHWNPVKHQWVKNVQDWPHSSYHRYVE